MLLKQPPFKGDNEIDQLLKILGILSAPDKDISPEIEVMPNNSPVFPKFNQVKFDEYFLNMNKNEIKLANVVYNPNQRIATK